MNPSRQQLIANAVSFQTVWFACVIGGNGWAVIATLINGIAHALWMKPPTRWWIYILLVGIFGFVFDLMLIKLNLLDFGEGNLNPLWLVLLWLNFGGTWHYSLHWLTKRPMLAVGLGGMAGTYSYYIGMVLGAVSFPHSLWLTLPPLWVAWASACGLMVYICKHELFHWHAIASETETPIAEK